LLESHLAKYRSLVPSLALLIHLLDGGVGPVGAASVERSLRWAKYLEAHARRVFAGGLRADLASATELSTRITEGKLGEQFRVRDVYHKGWRGLANRSAAQSAVDVLVEFDWLFASEDKPPAGRPTVTYRINPLVLALPHSEGRTGSVRKGMSPTPASDG